MKSCKSILATAAILLWGCGGGDPVGDTPTVSLVNPSTGTVGTVIEITGSNFRTSAEVLIGTLSATSVDLGGPTQLFASIPTGVMAGSIYDVTVRNIDATEVVFTQAFTAVAPLLQFVNSATKPSGNNGSTVIIEGDAFGDLQGTGQVLFSDGAGGTVAATIAAAADWTNTFIVTTVPAGAGTGPVVVQTGTGTSASLPFTLVSNAVFSPSTIAWTETQGLSANLSGHNAQFVPIDDAAGATVPYVYVSGGSANNLVPRTEVEFSIIQTDGTLSGWTSAASLPAGRAFHNAVAATPFNSKVQGSGHLYVLGGIETDGGQPMTTVYSAALNNNGTTGAFSASIALPAGLHSFGAVVFRGQLYVAGGATTDNAPVATLYRSTIDTLGNLGAWDALTVLPAARAYHGFNTFGGYLYVTGGETGTLTPDDGNFTNNGTKLDEILYAQIDLRTGDVGSWTVNASSMQKTRSKHSVLVAGGSLLVSAGLYAAAGVGSSENSFAQINSDGTVDSFGGATGSNTLLSEGGANLFNHAALAYIDATGTARVMVLGGDDVNNPGSKRNKVFFY